MNKPGNANKSFFLKKINLFDTILFNVAAVCGLNLIGMTALYGWSSLIWWVIIAIIFFVPYLLVTAELGAAYSGSGKNRGINFWIEKAFGQRSAGVATWIYWINVIFFMVSMILAIVDASAYTFDIMANGKPQWMISEDGGQPKWFIWIKVAIGIFVAWIIAVINLWKIQLSKWFPNIATIFKFFVLIFMLCALFAWLGNGQEIQTEWNSDEFSGQFGKSIMIIGILSYKLAGGELSTNAAKDMKNPRKQIVKACLVGGSLIILFYVLASLPVLMMLKMGEGQYSESGLGKTYAPIGVISALGQIGVEATSLALMVGIFAFLVVVNMFSSTITWTLGANRSLMEAGEYNNLPKFMAKKNANGSPVNVAYLTGIVSTITLIISGFLIYFGGGTVFDTVFAISLITFFVPYLYMFPAFLKLRLQDKKTPRPFKAGPNWFACILSFFGTLIIFIGIVTHIFGIYIEGFEEGAESIYIKIVAEEKISGWWGVLALIIGLILTLIIGFWLAIKAERERKIISS